MCGSPFIDIADRRVHVGAAQDGAADVAVRHRAQETILPIDHQGDLARAGVDRLDRLVDGSGRPDQRLAPVSS